MLLSIVHRVHLTSNNIKNIFCFCGRSWIWNLELNGKFVKALLSRVKFKRELCFPSKNLLQWRWYFHSSSPKKCKSIKMSEMSKIWMPLLHVKCRKMIYTFVTLTDLQFTIWGVKISLIYLKRLQFYLFLIFIPVYLKKLHFCHLPIQ